jgi:hypothetical protein
MLMFGVFLLPRIILNMQTRTAATLWGRVRELWEMVVCGWPMLYMAITSVAFFGLVLLIEKVQSSPTLFKLCNRVPKDVPAPQISEDDDVQAERQKMKSEKSDAMVQIQGLKKVYRGEYYFLGFLKPSLQLEVN